MLAKATICPASFQWGKTLRGLASAIASEQRIQPGAGRGLSRPQVLSDCGHVATIELTRCCELIPIADAKRLRALPTETNRNAWPVAPNPTATSNCSSTSVA